ncbi:MAG TPA: hypothetical protein VEV41_01410 [Terriglobales bacterium]|nr:hypothetical protein [Terriglobales bacterium]
MENDDKEIRGILKAAFPSVEAAPRRDLWPAILRRLDERVITTPWYDWAALALLACLLFLFPRFIPVLLYHL